MEGEGGQRVGLRPTKDHKAFPRCQEKVVYTETKEKVWKGSKRKVQLNLRGQLDNEKKEDDILDSATLPGTSNIIV